MVTKDKQWCTFEVLGPSLIYNGFNREISCHCINVPPYHRATTSPHHCQIFPTTWVWIWLVNTTQHSSDWLIVPTTANQIPGIRSPHHHVTMSLHEIFPTIWIWIWLVNTTQLSSDWLIVPTTANQITGIRSPCHRITVSLCHCTTVSPYHHITASPCHHVTVSPCHHMRFSPPHGYECDC